MQPSIAAPSLHRTVAVRCSVELARIGGLIVEDCSVTHTLGMLRQLGVWRSVLVGLDSLRRGP